MDTDLHDGAGEKERSRVKLTNLSGRPDHEIWPIVGFLNGKAEEIVVYHDAGPTEPPLVPTGTVTVFDIQKYPEWLIHVQGADIGCGMTWVDLPHWNADGFRNRQDLLDKLYQELRTDTLKHDLGKSNHFIDFLADELGHVRALVHTGSYKDRQHELTDFIRKSPQDHKGYFALYNEVVASAVQNRLNIIQLIQQVYGEAVSSGIQNDTVHNSVEVDESTGKGIIRKGTLKAKPGEVMVMPSSMSDSVFFYTAGTAVNESTYFGLPHGTGRVIKHSDIESKDVASRYSGTLEHGKVFTLEGVVSVLGDTLVPVMTPTGLGFPPHEMPFAYRKSSDAVKIMRENGLIGEVVAEMSPIAVIAHPQ